MGVHDSGYRQLFSFPIMVEELIRGFVKEDWVEQLDFDTLEKQNGSYVSDDLREREDDIVWRVEWRGSERWMYVYLLIEFQTEHEPFMGLRLLDYLTLLYQDLLRSKEVPPDARLPPVLPMVVYRGEREWTAPLDVRDLIETPPGQFGRYTPSMRYLLLEEVKLAAEELEAMSNLVPRQPHNDGSGRPSSTIPASLLLELALPVLRRRSLASPMISRPEPIIEGLTRH
ncbi:MAG: Rpn family recombination-promoting nuclease/putative transposase [Polyangia bacterium]